MASIEVIFIRHAEASSSWGDYNDPGLSDAGIACLLYTSDAADES